MPNRIIKESIRTSYEINDLSTDAEVTFYRLLTFADDFGRFQGDPRVLQSTLFPLKPSIRKADFTRWIAELVSANLIRLYISGDKPYGCFVSWKRHQNTRADKSKFPDPDKSEKYPSIEAMMEAVKKAREKAMNTDDITCKQMISDSPVLDTRTRNSILDTREGESCEKTFSSPGNRKNPPGKRSLDGWEEHNDNVPICFKDVSGWMSDNNINLPDNEFDYELNRFRDKFADKRYKDWIKTFRNYLRARYLDQEHFDHKKQPNGTNQQRKTKGDKRIETLRRYQ